MTTDHTTETPSRQPAGRAWIYLVALAVVAAGAAVWWLFIREPPPEVPQSVDMIDEPRQVDPETTPTPWIDATDVAVTAERLYLLDSGNNRILVMDPEGGYLGSICEEDDCAFLLEDAEAMIVDGDRLFVANTGRSEVAEIATDGSILATFPLPAGSEGEAAPSGLALAPDGTLYVSDRENGRVLKLATDGTVAGYVGPEEAPIRFEEPRGLDLDPAGNLYVADRLSGFIRKISPIGRELAPFSMISANPDISEPVDVLVIAGGDLVFMADAKRNIIHVFSRGTDYLGIFGLLDPSRLDSNPAIVEPLAMSITGNRVYVLDQLRGVGIFLIDTEFWLNRAA